MNNPLSFKNLLSGIIVTVIGGIILFLFLEGPELFGKTPEETPTPTSTVVQVIDTVSPITPTSTEVPVCNGAPQMRLSVGVNAVVCTKTDPVKLRDASKHSANSIDNLPPGIKLSVIGGPVCDETISWWYWEVRTESGTTGWIAEGGDAVDEYYVCPVE
jgi:Bacterial SH3 domain